MWPDDVVNFTSEHHVCPTIVVGQKLATLGVATTVANYLSTVPP